MVLSLVACTDDLFFAKEIFIKVMDADYMRHSHLSLSHGGKPVGDGWFEKSDFR